MLNFSKARKVIKLIADFGLVSGLKSAIQKWALSGSSVNRDLVGDLQMILLEDNPAVMTYAGDKKIVVNFCVIGFGIGSGGMFNICRIIAYLEGKGHRCNIYLVGNTDDGESYLNSLLLDHYPKIDARIVRFRGTMEDSHALIATSWRTAYYVRNQCNTVMKFYLIQDFEDMFYSSGSMSGFVLDTYGFGFIGLTAGKWLADVVERNYGAKCFSFGFSYDKDLYVNRKSTTSTRKVLFYARPETERRGFELGVLALSLVAKTHSDVEFVFVGTADKNWKLPFKTEFPGIVPIDQLPSLYQECAVALVISFTNLSLLPLEIMASGCAVVSNDGDNVRWLLNDDLAILVPARPAAIADGIRRLLDDSNLRETKIQRGQDFARSTDWGEELGKVESSILDALLTQ